MFIVRYVQSHLAAANGNGRSEATECQCPASIDINNVFKASFFKRAIKSFTVTTHLSRGFILTIRKSFRRGTTNSMKVFCETMCPPGAWTFRYLLDLQLPIGYLGTSWTFRYLLDLQVPIGPLYTSWTLRYLLDLQVPLGPLGTSWTFKYLLDLQVHL